MNIMRFHHFFRYTDPHENYGMFVYKHTEIYLTHVRIRGSLQKTKTLYYRNGEPFYHSKQPNCLILGVLYVKVLKFFEFFP